MVKLGNMVNLVVCQKSKMDDWIDHFKSHYATHEKDFTYEGLIFDLTDKKQLEVFLAQTKDAQEQHFIEDERTGESYLQENLYPYMIIGIINYDLLFRRSELLKLQDFTLMLDESSIIQNQQAKRSKFILKMNPRNVILLSGTPCSGKYENLWTQLHLLGWSISEDLYNKQYVSWVKMDNGDGFIHKIVDKDQPYKNVERLKDKLREYGAVFMKTEECFDLPEQTFIPVRVAAPKVYKKFMRSGIVILDDGTEFVGDTILTKRIRARQLCGMYSKEKLEAFKDLVESTQDRLIVFYNFTAELDAMWKIVKEMDRPVGAVNGQERLLEAYEYFNNSITFIQYQAGAKGLNLQKANKIIYFSPTEKCEDWMQSQKRIHRIGQGQPCFYYQMICKDTLEEDIYHALERGVDYTDELFKESSK